MLLLTPVFYPHPQIHTVDGTALSSIYNDLHMLQAGKKNPPIFFFSLTLPQLIIKLFKVKFLARQFVVIS